MKRHISIFALLLSVLATVGSAAVEPEQTVMGGYYFVEGKVLNGTLDTSRMSINGDGQSGVKQNLKEGDQVTFVATPDAGLKVAEWGSKRQTDTMFTQRYDNYEWSAATGEDPSRYTWTADPAVSSKGYLAVNFEYITFSISFNANGGSGTAMPSEGLFDIRSTIDLPKCTYTKEGYGMTGWTNAVGAAFADGETAIPGKRFWNPAITNFSSVLYANWTGKTYAATCSGVNCTVTPSAANGTYDRTFTVTWIKDADVGETSTVTVYDGADTARQILQRTTNTTTFDFKMSDLGKYYESVVIAVACTKNERNDLTLKKGVGVKAISWKTNNCAWVRSETDVNLPGLLASTKWWVKVEDNDVERGYTGPSPDSGTMFAPVTRELKGTPHQYTINYELQGGTEKSGGKYPANENFGDRFLVSAPTKTDRTFLGWIVGTNEDDLACAKWGITSGDVTRDVLPDKPCVNENDATGDVFFKNLTSIDNDQIWLKAKWSGLTRTITVTTDPKDAGSATGGGEIEDGTKATLEATPNDGYSFCCWTNGNEVVSTDNPWTFTVTADASFAAVFTGNVYTVTFRTGEKKPPTKDVVFGLPYGALPELEGDEEYAFGGWRTKEDGAGEKITSETIVAIAEPHSLYPEWVEKRTYTIAYDGNGATSGKMDPQMALCGVEVKLATNCFARTGYTFAGWTNTVKQAFYADGATVKDLADADETATLSAVWQANTYTVTFDGKGGLGNMDPPQEFEYDEPQALRANDYKKSPFDFVGWAKSPSGAIAYTDKEVVSNLTADANGNVTLYAKWGFMNELSVAADCDSERTDGRQPVNLTAANAACASIEYKDDPGGNGQVVRIMPVTEIDPEYKMSTELTGPGVLKFNYRASITETWDSAVGLDVTEEENDDVHYLQFNTNVSTWAECVIELTDGNTHTISWSFVSEVMNNDYALIDNIRWIPDGAGPEHPVPEKKDAVSIETAAVSDGKFTLSFKSDAKFDYNLLTNANLLIKEGWGKMGKTQEGTGETITFEPEIIEGQPQLFYKVETIQKK